MLTTFEENLSGSPRCMEFMNVLTTRFIRAFIGYNIVPALQGERLKRENERLRLSQEVEELKEQIRSLGASHERTIMDLAAQAEKAHVAHDELKHDYSKLAAAYLWFENEGKESGARALKITSGLRFILATMHEQVSTSAHHESKIVEDFYTEISALNKELKEAQEDGARESKTRKAELDAASFRIQELQSLLTEFESIWATRCNALRQRADDAESLATERGKTCQILTRDLQALRDQHAQSNASYDQRHSLMRTEYDRALTDIQDLKSELCFLSSSIESKSEAFENQSLLLRNAQLESEKRLEEFRNKLDNSRREIFAKSQARFKQSHVFHEFRIAAQTEETHRVSKELEDVLSQLGILESRQREFTLFATADRAALKEANSQIHKLTEENKSFRRSHSELSESVADDPVAEIECPSDHVTSLQQALIIKERECMEIEADFKEKLFERDEMVKVLKDRLTQAESSLIEKQHRMILIVQDHSQQLALKEEGFRQLALQSEEERSAAVEEFRRENADTISRIGSDLFKSRVENENLRIRLSTTEEKLEQESRNLETEKMSRENLMGSLTQHVDVLLKQHGDQVNCFGSQIALLETDLESHKAGIRKVCREKLLVDDDLARAKSDLISAHSETARQVAKYESQIQQLTRQWTLRIQDLSSKLVTGEKQLQEVSAERSLLISRMSELEAKIAAIDGESDNLITKMQQHILSLSEELDTKKSELKEAKFELTDFKREVQKLILDKEQGFAQLFEDSRKVEDALSNELLMAQRNGAAKHVEIEKLQVSVKEVEHTLSLCRADLETTEDALEAAKASIREKYEQAAMMRESHATDLYNAKMLAMTAEETLKKERAERTEQIADTVSLHEKLVQAILVANTEIERFKSELNSANSAALKIESENHDLSRRIAESELIVARHEKSLSDRSADLKLMGEKLQAANRDIAFRESAVEELRREIQRLQEVLVSNQQELAVAIEEKSKSISESVERETISKSDNQGLRAGYDSVLNELKRSHAHEVYILTESHSRERERVQAENTQLRSELESALQVNAQLIDDIERMALQETKLVARQAELESVVQILNAQIESIAKELDC